MPSTSLTCNICYVLFIHNSSRKTRIYSFKNKDDVFNRFQELKALLENETRKKIKVPGSNHDRQYTS